MRLWRFLILIPLIMLSGCSLLHRLPPMTYQGIQLRGRWTDEDLRYLKETLLIIPEDVKKSIDIITLREDTEILFYGDAGHCWLPTGEICIKRSSLRYVLIHEIGHAHTFKCGQRFVAEWERVAGRVYDARHRNLFNFPTDGLLTQYSATNALEDIADWVMKIYNFEDDFDRQAFEAILSFQIDKLPVFLKVLIFECGDPRYEAKLYLLRKYKFITEDTYKKILPCCRHRPF